MKTKIKILIGSIITIITCSIFLITTQAQEGYTTNDNGNIQSLNLLPNSNNVTLYEDVYYNLPLEQGTYTISTNNWQNSGQFLVVGSKLDNTNIEVLANLVNTNGVATFTVNQDNYKLQRFYVQNSTTCNIMLNSGNVALEYFPYGNYTNEKNIGITQLYYQLNGTTAKFYNREITSINTILNTIPTLQETIQMNNNTMAWNSNSIPNISNRILNDSQSGDSNREMILLELKNETIFNNLTFSRVVKNENRNIYLYNENKQLITTLTIMDSGDYNTYDITWFNNENKPIKYILFDNEKNFDIVYQINPTNAGAIYDNAYNIGYQAGYEDGIPAGIQKGINENKFQIDTTSASYIAGYEAGEQDTNILGGMVLTIVESPINIFKQIFNFNILGLDISQFIFSLLSLLLIVFLIKKIVK